MRKTAAAVMPNGLLDAVDRMAMSNFTTRSEVIRQAVLRELQRTGFAPVAVREEA